MEAQYPLIVFTLFLCLASGLLGFQGWLLFQGKGTRKFHYGLIVAQVASLGVGGIASFLHLHHWERLFNGFMHLNSGITQELIAIVIMVVFLAVLFVLLRRSTAEERALLPRYIGVVALVLALIAGFVWAHSYDMHARPAWHNVGLYLYYYSNELLLGAAGTWVLSVFMKQDGNILKLLAQSTGIAGVVSAVVIIACGFMISAAQIVDVGPVFHTTEPMMPAFDSASVLGSLFAGSEAALFWGVAVLVGSVTCAVIGFWQMARPLATPAVSVAALVCALAGGLAYRVILYAVALNFYPYF